MDSSSAAFSTGAKKLNTLADKTITTSKTANVPCSMKASGPQVPASFQRMANSQFAKNQIQMKATQSMNMSMKKNDISMKNMNTSFKVHGASQQQVTPANAFFFDQIESMKNMAQGARFSKNVSQAKENISFSVTGSVGKQITNFQDSAFGVARRGFGFSTRSAAPRMSMALAALPSWAEGEWGDDIKARKYMVGGNWKSNGDFDFANTFPGDVLGKADFHTDRLDVTAAPTFIHLKTVQDGLDKSKVEVCAQDVSEYGKGAYTGNITADQLADMGVKWTLTGHSERRTLFGETDEITALKTKMAIENGIGVLLCIGEQKDERESGVTDEVNARQLKAVKEVLTEEQWGKVVIAYEPVWAIGTGLVATPEQAQETQFNIRCWLAENISPKVAAATRILYGGSANAENAPDLIKQKDIDGFLVGGASLKPDFLDIIKAVDA